ncbi:MAG TPA: dienelactone hydrolase family protein [Rhodospirillales bacterium]|jgi:carboxymethylenebutenolidase|nr:dienelactone hydrolase family protein [Rhodospirillales bacterium]
MGETIRLTAADGHQLSAYRADPPGETGAAPKGGIVVIQEIFGVNSHVRNVADGFAAEGYVAIAPAIFDRFQAGVDLGYEDEDKTIGIGLKAQGNEHLDLVMADVRAAWEAASAVGKVGITGYCWGGFVVWAAACRLNFDAAVGYYGGGIIGLNGENPNCPTILHFGKHDQSIPLEDVEAISQAHPEVPVYIYDAGHGFNCDHRPEYNEEASTMALKRTMELFAENVG